MISRRHYLGVLFMLLVGMTTHSGCGYMVGAPHRQEIRSIHVENFTSTSFRRDLHLQLTAEIQSVIQQYSHFKLTDNSQADTRLTGRIVDLSKRVTAETTNDDPRQLQYGVAVEVTWEDLPSGRLLMQRQVPVDAATLQLLANGQIAPEVGQSRATAEKSAIHQLARQIVDQLEMPW
jgi:hypothetical protein